MGPSAPKSRSARTLLFCSATEFLSKYQVVRIPINFSFNERFFVVITAVSS